MQLLEPDQLSIHGKSAIARFLAYIKISKDNSCWNWKGANDPNGYGRMSFNGKAVYTPPLHL